MRILQLSTHSTLVPRHGGQIRSQQIARCLEQAGFEVKRVAVCWRTEHDLDDVREPIVDVRETHFWLNPAYRAALEWARHFADYYSILAVSETPHLCEALLAHIATSEPDVILLEHPWTWPLVRRVPVVRSGTVHVIYSSQNVETVLKRRILDRGGMAVPSEVLKSLKSALESVEALERDLVRAATATVVCASEDADIFSSWGAKRLIFARNGTVRKQRGHLADVLPPPLLPELRFALFVGSGHPPNIEGFFDFLAPMLPRLRPLERIVIVGTMCDGINAEIAKSGLHRYRGGRLVSLGFADNNTLDALIANAHALLLPIGYGSGSNVKTAEALGTGRPIVATGVAFRGFEDFRSLPSVTLADTAPAFEAAVRDALSKSRPEIDGIDVPRGLLWESTVAPLVSFLQSLR